MNRAYATCAESTHRSSTNNCNIIQLIPLQDNLSAAASTSSIQVSSIQGISSPEQDSFFKAQARTQAQAPSPSPSLNPSPNPKPNPNPSPKKQTLTGLARAHRLRAGRFPRRGARHLHRRHARVHAARGRVGHGPRHRRGLVEPRRHSVRPPACPTTLAD